MSQCQNLTPGEDRGPCVNPGAADSPGTSGTHQPLGWGPCSKVGHDTRTQHSCVTLAFVVGSGAVSRSDRTEVHRVHGGALRPQQGDV